MRKRFNGLRTQIWEFMKLEAEITKIIERADGVRKIAEIIRGQQNEIVQANAIIEAIEKLVSGMEVSEFMLSFPVVRRLKDLLDDFTES